MKADTEVESASFHQHTFTVKNKSGKVELVAANDQDLVSPNLQVRKLKKYGVGRMDELFALRARLICCNERATRT